MLFVALLVSAGASFAQTAKEVTVREINAISQDNINTLNMGVASENDANALIFNNLVDSLVTFNAVVLSDPRNSGLGNVSDGNPSRIHVFVRDTSAITQGLHGMGIQLVDGAYNTTGLINVLKGDIIEVVGEVNPFGSTMQISPQSITVLSPETLPDSLTAPVTITTGDANKDAGNDDGTVITNWDNLASLRGQYVRLENVSLVTRDISTDRPNWLVSSDGNTTILNAYDTSIRFRNDRDDYPETFNKHEDDFVPPPPGAKLNLQGFLVAASDDPFNRGAVGDALLSIVPFEDSDVEITEAPPIITGVTRPDFVADDDDVITIMADVEVDPTRTLVSANLIYSTSSDATEMTVAGTAGAGNSYSFEIPAQADGDFVTYRIEAEDSDGAVSASDDASYRVLADGIDEIADIQTTADGGEGDSPFRDLTTPMTLSVTVQSQPDVSGLVIVQDNADLDGWSGIFVDDDDFTAAVKQGDVVSITDATIEERFGVTQLIDVTFTVTDATPGNPTLGYKTVPTSVLVDDAVAEAHEGMLLNFENVQIVSNDEGFGEWSFSSDGTPENAIRADDASDAISSDFAETTFQDTDNVAFIRGIWWYSFGNFKLVPEDPATDFGTVTDIEDLDVPGSFRLAQNYPNPFNPQTTIAYELAQSGFVTLDVYDLMGRRVRTLVSNVQPAGPQAVTFDASGLASGVYLYRLTAGTQTLTRSMLLMK